ncbi:MAG TPA: sulfate transporter [Verrucomicrobiales bacterium]|nr:sulfate transporter [Verrucomicrobiales bacterium]HRJ08898.1 SulP family inorganic anion transporter [Prosthecobacter sp.]HRK15219.1 SulP family inorganic anion transporter [Prosthecobacter sp.]
MPHNKAPLHATLPKDLAASVVLFLVALPLCMGVAVASGSPPISGILAGIIGGIVVGALSGSHKSVSGPAAGLISITISSMAVLGSFESFLLAVLVAGVIQVLLGVLRAGFVAVFFPGSVVKGLLAGIGVILILKQIPHLLGHDADPMGDKSFFQPDNENTFSELFLSLIDIHPGAALVGLFSIVLVLVWDRVASLKKFPVPSAVVVIVLAVLANALFRSIGGSLVIEPSHLVQVPVAGSIGDFFSMFRSPDFSQLSNPAIYTTALLIAAVASLETLLNLDAVDKIDPDQRRAPPNRELVAQGAGNIACGLLGGLPLTSVIVRSSVNINAGARTKLSAITQGFLLLLCVMFLPGLLNEIPLAAVAALLFMTGLRLASPALLRQMWSEGRNQFAPFIITVIAIVLTDPLRGILIGLGVSVLFLLHSNLRRPLRRIRENHVGGEVLRIELANQVSFLSRPALEKTLFEVPRGGHVLLDARDTDYIDPDVLDLIADFRKDTASAHGVQVSLVGFKDRYHLEDRIQFVDYSTREVQSTLTPDRVLQILKEGNERFLNKQTLIRDHSRVVNATSAGQFPMAAVLGCIDSRAPAEVVFDLGLGDVFSARVAGNIATPELLGSLEYACAVVGSKLVVVLGHTSCGAVNAAVDLLAAAKKASEATPCGNLDGLVTEIQQAVDTSRLKKAGEWASPAEKAAFANEMARLNVVRTIKVIRQRSATLDKLVNEGKIAIVGALYDVGTGKVDFFQTPESSVQPLPLIIAAAV